jgi:hypothetical protein
MRKRIHFSSVFLICLLVLSFVSLSFGNFASAGNVACNFLPNNYVDIVDTPNEVRLSQDTAACITSELAKKYPQWTMYNCTKSTYLSIIGAAQSYDKVVTYSKGHRGRPYGDIHMSLVDHNGANVVDHEIYALTSSKNVVTFIWHCQTANDYTPNGNNTDANNRAFSMPYAWTKNNGMAKYGTSGSQVYLGWTNRTNLMIYNFTSSQYHTVSINHPNGVTNQVGSPQYEWGLDPTYKYAQVAGLYWYYMGKDYTTTAALNQVSYTVYFSMMPFAFSPLNDWLVVYGNGNVKLP